MKKLAWIALILLIVGVVVVTLGATNYGGFGTAMGDAFNNSFALPIRNWAIDTWLFIGQSGWYILAATLTISILGGFFMVFIVYGLFWKKGIQERLLHRTSHVAPTYQSQPSTVIPVTNLQSTPTPEAKEEEAK